MLKINKVDFGLIPFGPGNGQPAVKLDIGENDEELKKNDHSTLYNDIVEKIKEQDLEQEWLNAINGTLSVFIVFTGGVIEKEKHWLEWDNFNRVLSRNSLDVQKTLKLRPDQVRPPFCIWAGVPTDFTGNRQFYQYFNCTYGLLKNKDYGQLALQEIINHQFSSIIVLNDQDDLITEIRGKYKLDHKLIILDTKNNGKDKVAQYCFTKKLKYNHASVGQHFLEIGV